MHYAGIPVYLIFTLSKKLRIRIINDTYMKEYHYGKEEIPEW